MRDKWNRQDYKERTIGLVLADIEASRQEAAQVTQTPEGEELATHEPGDILAGRTFARAMRSKLRYMGAADKWLRWDGTRWAWCACGEEMAAAKKVAGKILEQAAKLFSSDPNRYKKLMAFATSLQNLKRLQAMIELAKSEDGMSIGHMAALDSDPWLLGVRNGVVNLKDGGLLAPDPAMLITRQCAAEYHDDAQCPKWLEFLNQIFNSDQETIGYIQRALGYTYSTSARSLLLRFLPHQSRAIDLVMASRNCPESGPGCRPPCRSQSPIRHDHAGILHR